MDCETICEGSLIAMTKNSQHSGRPQDEDHNEPNRNMCMWELV